MTKPPKDVGASVRSRLLRLARDHGDDFQVLLTRYANERLLYRLSMSPHATQFVLKGAALFTLWTGRPHRATRDLDLLGFGDPTEGYVRQIFEQILSLGVGNDGVEFDPGSLNVRPIREDQEYGGIRVTVDARITVAKIRLQIDVGFGDVITPAATAVEFPGLLDFPSARLRAYPAETVVAEKVEAMVQLGLANSRMKDFYDLAALSRMFPFDGGVLVRAISATFARRKTPLPVDTPVALTRAFFDDTTKKTQWAAFARKSSVGDAGDLMSTVEAVARFVSAPLAAAVVHAGWDARWPVGGPWNDTPGSRA